MITAQKVINALALQPADYYTVPGTRIVAVHPSKIALVKSHYADQTQYAKWLAKGYALQTSHLDRGSRIKHHICAAADVSEAGVYAPLGGNVRASAWIEQEWTYVRDVTCFGTADVSLPGLLECAVTMEYGITIPDYDGIPATRNIGYPLMAKQAFLWGVAYGPERRIQYVPGDAAELPPTHAFVIVQAVATGASADAVVTGNTPALLNHESGPWPLISGPSVFTRSEHTFLDGVLKLGYIATNNADLASRLTGALPSVPVYADRVALQARIAKLEANPHDTMAMVWNGGVNPYEFVSVFKPQAAELLSRTGMEEDVDLGLANARLANLSEFVGVCPGATDVSSLTPVPSEIPSTVPITIVEGGDFTWSGQSGVVDNADLPALARQLKAGGRTITVSYSSSVDAAQLSIGATANITSALSISSATGTLEAPGVTPASAGDCLGYVMVGSGMRPLAASSESVIRALLTPGFMDVE